MYKFFAPELSAQFNKAAFGKPHDTLNLAPAAPLRPYLVFNKQQQPRVQIPFSFATAKYMVHTVQTSF